MAERVGSTANGARIDAFVLQADEALVAAFGIGRAAGNADGSPAGLAAGALAVGDAGSLALTEGADATIDIPLTLDLGPRSGNEVGRALTNVGVVLHLADGILSTEVGLADIHALVGEPVAELVCGAVGVLKAVDLRTPVLVGITLVQAAGGTDALADVVPGDADGARAALEEVTGGLTSVAAVQLLADVRFGALGVGRAFVVRGDR